MPKHNPLQKIKDTTNDALTTMLIERFMKKRKVQES